MRNIGVLRRSLAHWHQYLFLAVHLEYISWLLHMNVIRQLKPHIWSVNRIDSTLILYFWNNTSRAKVIGFDEANSWYQTPHFFFNKFNRKPNVMGWSNERLREAGRRKEEVNSTWSQRGFWGWKESNNSRILSQWNNIIAPKCKIFEAMILQTASNNQRIRSPDNGWWPGRDRKIA